MHTRLGLNVHRDAWPTAAGLSAYEAAGFAWVQVHTPPRTILADRRAGVRHARALRGVLDATRLRLLLHAPDDLSAGTSEHDRAFDGLLDYAAAAGAELITGRTRTSRRSSPRALRTSRSSTRTTTWAAAARSTRRASTRSSSTSTCRRGGARCPGRGSRAWSRP